MMNTRRDKKLMAKEWRIVQRRSDGQKRERKKTERIGQVKALAAEITNSIG
jgi:hypothetical protein